MPRKKDYSEFFVTADPPERQEATGGSPGELPADADKDARVVPVGIPFAGKEDPRHGLKANYADVVVEGDGDPDVIQELRDMRYVYSKPASTGEPLGVRALRRQLKDSPDKFFARKQELESALYMLKAKKAGNAPAAPPPDEVMGMDDGAKKVEVLIEEFLEGARKRALEPWLKTA